MIIGIVELATVCESHERRNRRLFGQLGAWLTSDDPPVGALGRLVTEACHRHAEHAALWSGRRPLIPVDRSDDEATAVVTDAGTYRRELEALLADVIELDRQLDRDLDPSTRRVIEIVSRDLASMVGRLDGLG